MQKRYSFKQTLVLSTVLPILALASVTIANTDASAQEGMIVVVETGFMDLEEAFNDSALVNDETIKYQEPATGTLFDKADTITITKDNLTLQGFGGNFTEMKTLLSSIPTWSDSGIPADIDNRISTVILSAQDGLATIKPLNSMDEFEDVTLFVSNATGNDDFNVKNMGFSDFNFTSTNLLNGGVIIGALSNGMSMAETIGTISTSSFDKISVDITGHIVGGGLIGISARDKDGTIGLVSNSIFSKIDIETSNLLIGGGLIGIYSHKAPVLEGVSNNIFNDIAVVSTDAIYGGGLIGVTSQNTNLAEIGDISNNIFNDITVEAKKTGDSISGGGVIGIYSHEHGGTINDITTNLFRDIQVTSAGSILGSGVIGTYSPGDENAIIGAVRSNFFDNIKITTTAGNLEGGGIIGARTGADIASIGESSNNNFNDIDIDIASELRGGGIIGASAFSGTATVNTVNNSHFNGIDVTSETILGGGGIIGALTGNGTAEIKDIIGNRFIDIDITSRTEDIQGGGIIGAYSQKGFSKIGNISSNRFTDINITSEAGSIFGGGILGAFLSDDGDIEMGSISANKYVDITVKAKNHIVGGGIVGGYSKSSISIDNVSGDTFDNIDIIAENGYLAGGGLIGVAASEDDAEITGINHIFIDDINIDAMGISGAPILDGNNTLIGGGIIGAYSEDGASEIGSIDFLKIEKTVINATSLSGGGLIGAFTETKSATIGNITNTTIIDNNLTVTKDIQGGGIIGAFVKTSGSATIGNISDTNISDNTISSTSGNVWGGLVYAHDGNANGMAFHNSTFTDNVITAGGDVYGLVSFDTSNSVTTQAVSLTSTIGESTVFQGNTINGVANSLFFGDIKNSGTSQANASLTITPALGGTVALLDPIKVAMTSGKTFTMNIGGQGELTWGGANILDAAGGSTMTFGNGSNTTFTDDFSVKNTNDLAVRFNSGSNVAIVLNDRAATTPLFAGANTTVTLESNVHLQITGARSAGAPELAPNTVFSLMDVKTLTGSFSNIDDTHSLQQGLARVYDIKTEKQGNKITATIISGVKAHEQASVPAQAQAASMATLNQGGTLLSGAGIANAQQAVSNLHQNATSAGGYAGSDLAFFLAIGGGNSDYGDTNADVSSFSFVAGLANEANLTSGRLLYGAFFEQGTASVDSDNPVNSTGDNRYYGGGIFARLNHVSNFYGEASLRIGNSEVSQNSLNYAGFVGQNVGYSTSGLYYATHIGAGYKKELNPTNSIDLYGKYYWTLQTGDTATLAGDVFTFDDINSHRTRLGVRYTHAITPIIAPYVGVAWDHEFDGDATYQVQNLTAATPTIQGDTGMLELGVKMKSSETSPLSLNLGVEGYTGVRKGVSGNLKLTFEF